MLVVVYQTFFLAYHGDGGLGGVVDWVGGRMGHVECFRAMDVCAT